MKKLFVCFIYLFGVIFFNTASALSQEQIEHEETLTKLATGRCDTEQIEGSDYSIKVLANGKVEVRFFGKKGGEVAGKFVYENNEWEGRQKVLKEHQAKENSERRRCIKEELTSLRGNYTTVKKEPSNCFLAGVVFDPDTNKPLSGVWVDIYRDMGSIQQQPKNIKAIAATTGLNGDFKIDCNWVKKTQYPITLALRHRDWPVTKITGPIIDQPNEWDGINIPVQVASLDIDLLKEVIISFSRKEINSTMYLTGKITNKSNVNISCFVAKLHISETDQDGSVGFSVFEVKERNLQPGEIRTYRKNYFSESLDKISISLWSKDTC